MTWYMGSKEKRAIRRELFAKQLGLCVYCNRPMLTGKDKCRKARFATIDHIKPLVVAFDNDRQNLVMCCRICNEVKASLPAEAFIVGLLWLWLFRTHPLLAHRLVAECLTLCRDS